MAINYKQLSDSELHALLKENRRKAKAAFDEIYNRYSSKIYTYCHKVLDSHEVADDIFQDTFAKFFESAKNKKEIANIGGFLIRIARNSCINEKSRRHNDSVPLDEFKFPVFDKSYESKELNDILETALDALPDEYKEALVMKEFMDMTYQEIADSVGTTLANVRVRIFRAKNKLREIMAPYIKDLT
jgi:RNA polymerase sigma-70 factor (ECF subfamily)